VSVAGEGADVVQAAPQQHAGDEEQQEAWSDKSC
jgi:hypothetical protein